MNHKHKVKLARRLQTADELKAKVPIFQTAEWEKRRQTKRIKTTRKRYGDNAFSDFGKKTPPVPAAAASKGGRVSPSNFKNNPKLASRAGSVSRRKSMQVKKI